MVQIKPEKVNVVIGSGGKTIKGLIEETGVMSIDVNDLGIVSVMLSHFVCSSTGPLLSVVLSW